MPLAERLKIGIDVGGTFTDLFVWSSNGGGVQSFKVLSTPEDPSVGLVDGLRAVAASRGVALEEAAARIDAIVHGTTVATNAVLTRGGARTGLLTTEGVRDALEMRRGIREAQYDNRFPNVVPLVPRFMRRPVPCRIDARGGEVQRFDAGAVRDQARALARDGARAIAVCFLNAFANPAHERAAVEIVRAEAPGAFVCASTDVLPTIRFYDRTSTTVLNAYVGPVLRGYLEALTSKLCAIGFRGVLLVMQSNGGVALPDVIERLPATTLLSGPAAGPSAAVAFTGEHDRRDCILVDMGGTSFDASLVRAGAAAMTYGGEIDRLRIALPMLSITTIGAGGGSVALIDAGGMLRVGPRSAGAMPGPACYGRGGVEPTCTDANVVLGYLDPEFFAGGRLKLDARAARESVRTRVGERLGVDVEEAAVGIYRVINANMAHGVRLVTVERGLDPREFPLVVAGGAGGVHACPIADELDVGTIVVPAFASVLCAAGMLLGDLSHDLVRTLLARFSDLDARTLRRIVAEMVAEGEAQLRIERVDPDRIEHALSLDLRYAKQYHEVTLPVPRDAIDRGDLASIARAFHAEHDRLYGYSLADGSTDIELINVRVRSIGRTDKPSFPRLPEGDGDARAARRGERRAWVPERASFEAVPVYDGHRLRAGDVVAGPALVERVDTTILVSAAYRATVDALGTIVLRKEARS